MSDKRQRARVQGSWAKPVQKPQRPSVQDVQSASASGSWKSGPQSFEFHQPADPIRKVPAEKVIENAGDYEISQGPSGVSRLRLIPGFLLQEEADWMFSKLLAELPWSQKTNYRMMGDAYEEPRLTCWYGELPYTYSRSTMEANAQWHPVLATLRLAVEQKSAHKFNSLLCNLYRDGKDSIGWHSDSEPSLGPQPIIASLSLGDTRVFSLRKQPLPEDKGDFTYVERIRVPLAHGTLLLMEGCTQADWQHQVAKEYHDRGPRINLTFRTIYPEPQRSGGRFVT
ncbi:alpha-ketoglutarate-dependent dioxygenase alkB homolog 3 isoform X1 [Danio rerio]|uniref:Alpha-ketoglutarate-dependent dioxygenase alkB homolog 3 n=1 Tax=Danio rerio TaxID=7955 RepID=F1QRD8_DANRE|nr:alpha-ketoglutarate-dependent dioxygenase alkB homolog 3 [Danio rerio]XP_005163201.1 alpha-ketoglutarate-dependent dioxygenase alkB homolog 3 isoform X1 [Danio rerio]XP_009296382.1 alpha-ketoglutarate-dependent dioxygenase alkB homolog 3 isoform X1 [Danio rerio]XP_017209591.1 alpha-ketoglutarate-dependent dioxygenase alkB homolog 3 isoform X1 [Danio rerio]|eukprot:NP_001003511.2 alpha-ketoglutarate-dependent dioxygenase alkB homolog 3 [Danio rerio]